MSHKDNDTFLRNWFERENEKSSFANDDSENKEAVA